jgi:tryptophan-rich sensory protein
VNEIIVGAVYAAIILSLVTADIGFNSMIRPPWLDEWNFLYGPVYCAVNILMAGYQLGLGRIGGVILYAGMGLAVFIIWWMNPKNRNRRKKWAKKAKEKVVDLGGRLGVKRPASARAYTGEL